MKIEFTIKTRNWFRKEGIQINISGIQNPKDFKEALEVLNKEATTIEIINQLKQFRNENTQTYIHRGKAKKKNTYSTNESQIRVQSTVYPKGRRAE